MVYVEIYTHIQVIAHAKRLSWIWKEAQLSLLRSYCAPTNWDFILGGTCVDTVTANLTNYILSGAKQFIPIRECSFSKSSHPWVTEQCLATVAEKHAAEGHPSYKVKRDACAGILLQEFRDHALRTKEKISGLPVSSKKWWKLCSSLMVKKNAKESIPPLQNPDGSWGLSVSEKVETLAKCF